MAPAAGRPRRVWRGLGIVDFAPRILLSSRRRLYPAPWVYCVTPDAPLELTQSYVVASRNSEVADVAVRKFLEIKLPTRKGRVLCQICKQKSYSHATLHIKHNGTTSELTRHPPRARRPGARTSPHSVRRTQTTQHESCATHTAHNGASTSQVTPLERMTHGHGPSGRDCQFPAPLWSSAHSWASGQIPTRTTSPSRAASLP